MESENVNRRDSIHEWESDGYTISTDKCRLNLDVVHGFLSTCYWAAGIPRDTVERSIEESLVFGMYLASRQVGFARVITDFATFGYLADVFILKEFRGKGLGKALVEAIVFHQELQGFRRWLLGTRDAHGLYEKFGFKPLSAPERLMEIWNADIYLQSGPTIGR